MTAKRGGHRPGAGRKPGTPNKAALDDKAIALMAETRGRAVHGDNLSPEDIISMSPLMVLQYIMARELMTGDWAAAKTTATAAAPYVHAKLATVDMSATLKTNAEEMTDAELATIASGGGGDTVDAQAGED